MSSDSSGSRRSTPRPVASYAGPELFSGQPARQAPVPSWAINLLRTFSLDFWLRPQEVNFHCHGSSSYPPPMQVPLVAHFSKGCGFRVDICREELVLKLGSGEVYPETGNMLPGACTSVPVSFPRELRADKWSRVSVVVDTSVRSKQTAYVFVDAEPCATVPIPRERQYVPSEMLAVLVGSEDFRGEIENLQLFGCVVSPKDMVLDRPSPEKLAATHLRKAAANLWTQMSFPDCEVVAEQGGRWPAHRCILMAGSPVLKRMLEGGMRESQGARTCVTIRNAATADVEAFLHFLYTGSLPPQEAGDADGWSVIGALVLADMYDVQDMVQLTVSELEAGLCEENVVEVVRVLGKRKAHAPMGAAYKRICRRVRENDVLHDKCMDNL